MNAVQGGARPRQSCDQYGKRQEHQVNRIPRSRACHIWRNKRDRMTTHTQEQQYAKEEQKPATYGRTGYTPIIEPAT